MTRLNPDAWATTGDTELDAREGVQEVDAQMIYEYVLAEDELPTYSARPFATWLDENWNEFIGDDGLTINRNVIYGALADWCGGRTR